MDNSVRYGVAGGLASLTVDLVYYPLETIKTRIMGSSKTENLLKQANKISKFKGFSCQMIVSFPYSFTFFFVYSNLRRLFKQESHSSNIVAAACAEGISNIVRNPLELVKQQLMVGRQSTVSSSMASIYKNRGLRGFYVGYSPTLVRDIAFSTIQMPIYQHLKKPISQFLGTEPEKPYVNAIAGSSAALLAAFLTCPLDVIKTRHMTRRMESESVSVSQVISSIKHEEGVHGFFKGVKLRCTMLTFGGVIYFYSLGVWKKVLDADATLQAN